jgi:dipeptidyl-peptidase 4
VHRRPRRRSAPLALETLALLVGACVSPSTPRLPPLTTAAPPSAATSRVAADPAPSSGDARGFIRQFAATNGFRYGQPQRSTPTPDGRAVLFLRSGPREGVQSLFETDLRSGRTREILAPASLLKGPESLSVEERARRQRMRVTSSGFTSFDLSADGAKVLVSLSGRLFVLSRASGEAHEVATGEGAAIDPRWSPDGRRVYYVRDHDLYAIGGEATDREVAVTHGGTPDRSHGLAEFVAEEELDRYTGYWVSPDGARVAYETADTSKVERLTIPDPSHPEGAAERFAYPRPGKPNADVTLAIAPSHGGPSTPVVWDRDRYPYLAQASWQTGAPLTLYVMSRLQKDGSTWTRARRDGCPTAPASPGRASDRGRGSSSGGTRRAPSCA